MVEGNKARRFIGLLKKSAARARLDSEVGTLTDEVADRATLRLQRFEDEFQERTHYPRVQRSLAVARLTLVVVVLIYLPGDVLSYDLGTWQSTLLLTVRGLSLVPILNVVFRYRTWAVPREHLVGALAAYGGVAVVTTTENILSLTTKSQVQPAAGLMLFLLVIAEVSLMDVVPVSAVLFSVTLLQLVGSMSVADELSASLFARSLLSLMVATLGTAHARLVQRDMRKRFLATRRLERSYTLLQNEKRKADMLLSLTLPAAISARLRRGEAVIADQVDQLPVAFMTLGGMSKRREIRLINQLFEELDELLDKHQLQKVKSISSSTVLVCGDPFDEATYDPREAALELARYSLEAVVRIATRFGDKGISLKVGIHVGRTIVGVIGESKLTFDIHGDCVNVASRVCSQAPPGNIFVSAAFRELIPSIDAEDLGQTHLKGKGMMTLFCLNSQMDSARMNNIGVHGRRMSLGPSDLSSEMGMSEATSDRSGGPASVAVRSAVAAVTGEVDLRRWTRAFVDRPLEHAYWTEAMKSTDAGLSVVLWSTLAVNVALFATDSMLQSDNLALAAASYVPVVPAMACFWIAKGRPGRPWRWHTVMAGYAFLVVAAWAATVVAEGEAAALFTPLRLILLSGILLGWSEISLVPFVTAMLAGLVGMVAVAIMRPGVFGLVWMGLNSLTMTLLGSVRCRDGGLSKRVSFFLDQQLVSQRELLSAEKSQSDRILAGVLPKSVIDLLLDDSNTHRTSIESLCKTVLDGACLQLDLCGFTSMASKMVATQLVAILNSVFASFDEAIAESKLEPLVPRGDAVVVIAGLPTPREDGVVALVKLGLEFVRRIHQYNEANKGLLDGQSVRCRIGIGSGMLSGGILGRRQFVYDCWGPALDKANEMEQGAKPMTVMICAETYEQVKDDLGHFDFEKRKGGYQVSLKAGAETPLPGTV